MAIKTIGVLGAGQMGSGIAQIAASKGYKVILRDIKQEFCDNALTKMRAGLEKRVAAGKTTQEAVEATMANITTTVELEGVKDCDMVIEAAPEILDLKRSTFKDLGEIVRDDCILCTNTSSMSITEIMSQCKNPERCAGMHFFFPVMAMKLVEVIRGQKTSDATVAAVYEVAKGMGKTAVECKTDTPGFIVNRALLPMLNEACVIVGSFIGTVEDVDNGMKLGCNHPMGPLELADMIGLDILLNVMNVLSKEYGEKYHPSLLLRKLVTAGFLGRKSGAGFYIYQNGRKMGVNPALTQGHKL